jgi:hypothetical protein
MVSEVNACAYYLTSHASIGKRNVFTVLQTRELRAGTASFDNRHKALAALTKKTSRKIEVKQHLLLCMLVFTTGRTHL